MKQAIISIRNRAAQIGLPRIDGGRKSVRLLEEMFRKRRWHPVPLSHDRQALFASVGKSLHYLRGRECGRHAHYRGCRPRREHEFDFNGC